MPRRGLKLAEVLVIVVVVLVLASMLILTGVRDGHVSFRHVCMNNLRKIGIGLVLYSADFGDYYPKARGPGGESRPMASLALLYGKYVSDKRIFRCPATTDNCDGLTTAVGERFDVHGSGTQKACSYAYDDTRPINTGADIVIAGDAPPVGGGIDPQTGLSKNSDNHNGMGQMILMFGGDVVIWARNTINPCIPGDDIYTAADPKNPGASDSYIHQ